MASYVLSGETVERYDEAARRVLDFPPGVGVPRDREFPRNVPEWHAVLITSETATNGRYPCKVQYRDEQNNTWVDHQEPNTGWAVPYNGDSRSGEPLTVTATRYDGIRVSMHEDGLPVYAIEVNPQTSHSRWLRFTNEELIDTIPAYGLVRITGGTETPVFEGRKPDRSDAIYTWVNGPDAVAPDAVGYCTRDFPAWVAYDESDGPPLPGEEWGPVPDGFKLRKGVAGYVVVGATTGDTGSKRVQVIHASAERPFWAKITSTDGAGAYSWIEVAAGAGGTWASPTAAREGKLDTDPWQNPAYELNHKLDVAVGTVVRMWRAYWENYLTGEYQEYTFLVGGFGNTVRPVFVTGPAVSGYFPARIDRRDENVPDWVPVEPSEVVWAVGYNNESLSVKRYKGLLVSVNPNDGVPVYAVANVAGGSSAARIGCKVRSTSNQFVPAISTRDFVPWDIVDYDYGGCFDVERNGFRVPEEGVYEIGAVVHWRLNGARGPRGLSLFTVDAPGTPYVIWHYAEREEVTASWHTSVLHYTGNPVPGHLYILSAVNGTSQAVEVGNDLNYSAAFWIKKVG